MSTAARVGLGLVMIAIVAGSCLGIYTALSFFTPVAANSETARFTIRDGASSAEVADLLERQGLIRNALAFRIIAKVRGLDHRFQAGDYEVRRDVTTGDLLTTLTTTRPNPDIRVTLPEGWRLEEVAQKLADAGLGDRDTYVSLMQAGSYDLDVLSSRPDGAGLEGYIFPDTYRFGRDATPERVVRTMLENFGRKFTPAMRQQMAGHDLTLHQVVTLASIVEREAQIASERGTIASVYLNRLEHNMPLQADPTVQYALGQRGNWWPADLSLDDLQIDSPENTYRNKGLPPNPICSPGLAALQAVLNPADTDYLYFVARGDGSHVFARTLEEHNRNVAEYQK